MGPVAKAKILPDICYIIATETSFVPGRKLKKFIILDIIN